jgi:hypothetical protein
MRSRCALFETWRTVITSLLVWLAEPASCTNFLWASEAPNKEFAKPWIGLLKEEIGAAKASIDRKAIHAVALEGREPKRKFKSI